MDVVEAPGVLLGHQPSAHDGHAARSRAAQGSDHRLQPLARTLRLENITAIEYSIARGSVAAYYPEANVLVPLDYIDRECGTPSYKSIPVRIYRAGSEKAGSADAALAVQS